MNRGIRSVLLASLVACAVCGSTARGADETPVLMKATLTGPTCLATDVSLFVANTDEDWSRAMSACFSAQRAHAEYLTYDVNGHEVRGRSPGREVFDRLRPPLDLADHTAVFLCSGTLGSGAFRVGVKSVAEQADAVEVRYDVVKDEDARKPLETSSPFTIFFIAKTEKPVRFISRDKVVATVDGGAREDVVNGLQLLLDVKPAEWTIGDKIEFGCTVKNVTGKPWRIFRWGLGSGGALEVADDVAVAVKPQFTRDATRELTDADCPFLRAGEKRFTLTGRIQRDGTLVVNEPQGGEYTWELTAGSFTVRATLGVEDKDWTLPMEQMEMRWTGKVRSNAVKVTLAEAKPAHVDLAPEVPDEANGLKLALEVTPATWRPGDKIELTCSATNVSDKPIRLPAWGLDMFAPLEFTDAAGKKLPLPSYAAKHVREYVPEDFPTLAPGETKRFTANASFDAHGGKQYLTVWEGRGGAWGYELPNGTYQVSASAENKDSKERAAFPTLEQPLILWTGKALSSPVKVTVGGAGLAWGEAVNGLQLALEVAPATWKPGAQVEFACTVKNVSDKPIRVAVWGLDLAPAIEITDPKGTVLPNDGGRNGLRRPPADSFPTIAPGELRRFTLPGRVTDKKMLIVNELLGGIWHWTLADGEYALRAELWRDAGNEGAWAGRAFSAPINVTMGDAPAPAKVDLAPAAKPGEAVNGLKLTLSTDRAFLTMTPRELRRATEDTPRWDVEPAKLTFTFTNTSDKPIKLDAYDLAWSRLKLDVTGPDGESVRILGRRPNVEREMVAPTEKDFPTVEPGQSWTYPGWAPFPGIFRHQEYLLLKPGDYRVKATYSRPEDTQRPKEVPGENRLWSGSVTSNELVLAAVVPGEPVNGLKMTIAANKTDLKTTYRKPADVKPGESRWDVAPAEVTISFTNVSDRPIKIGTFNLPTSGVQPDVVGPDADSAKITRRRMMYDHMRVLAEGDFPTLAPGETWTSKETYSFPSSRYEWVVQLMKTGEYRLRLVYARAPVAAGKNSARFPLIEGAWSGTVMSNELVFKASQGTPIEGPTRVDLAPAPGATVKGLKLTLSADRTFLAMTARELERATKDTPRYNIGPAKLKLTFTNAGGAPIKLATYDWSWGLTKLDVRGPDPQSVRIVRQLVERMMAAPTAANYPTLQPGESWTDAWQPSFPGNYGEANYVLLKPGAYRVRVTYAVEDRHLAMSPHAAGAWTGTVASNDVVFTVGEAGAPVNGLKLTIAADKTEMKMTPLNLRRATRDQAHYKIEPVALTVTLANVSDKPIKVDAYDLVWSRLRFLVDGPAEHSVVVTQRMVDRQMRLPDAGDYPVIEPGKSWTLARAISFPGDVGGNTYVLNAPGEYRVKIVYSVPELRVGSNAVSVLTSGIWRGTVVSNELALKGVDQ